MNWGTWADTGEPITNDQMFGEARRRGWQIPAGSLADESVPRVTRSASRYFGNVWPDCSACTSAATSGCATWPWTCVNGHTLLNGFQRVDTSWRESETADHEMAEG